MTEANGNTGRVGFSTCCCYTQCCCCSAARRTRKKAAAAAPTFCDARRMLANPYKCRVIATNALPSIRMAFDCLRNCCENNENMLSWGILGACSECSQHPMNDRECLRTPTNVWRSPCDHCELVANCIRKPIRRHIRHITV